MMYNVVRENLPENTKKDRGIPKGTVVNHTSSAGIHDNAPTDLEFPRIQAYMPQRKGEICNNK